MFELPVTFGHGCTVFSARPIPEQGLRNSFNDWSSSEPLNGRCVEYLIDQASERLMSEYMPSDCEAEQSAKMDLSRQSILNLAKRGALYTALILLSDSVALALDSVLLSRNMFHYFTLFTLAQAGLLFFFGGAVDIAGSLSVTKVKDRVTKSEHDWSEESHRKAQSRAAPFIMTGVFLSIFSFVLAYPFN